MGKRVNKKRAAINKRANAVIKDNKIKTVAGAKKWKKDNRPAAIAGAGKATRTKRKVNRTVVRKTRKAVRKG